MAKLTSAIKKLTGILKTRKQEPTQRFLYYDLTHTGDEEDFHYIDLARDLSAVNRRLYRQGMMYHIANISIHDADGSARCLFGTAPNTWALHLAWKKCFFAWKKQRAMLISSSDGVLESPTWSDFKVYLNKDHVNDVDWPTPKDTEQSSIVRGEWDYADIGFWRSGTRYDNHAIGLMGAHSIGSSITDETSGDDTSYEGYICAIECLQEVLRNRTDDDSFDAGVDDSVLIGMTNEFGGAQVEEQLLDFEDEGMGSPYSSELLGGADNPTVDNASFPARECDIASSYSPMAQVGGFPVPCGLLQIETKSGTDGNVIGVLIEIAPGNYRGVAATPMGE